MAALAAVLLAGTPTACADPLVDARRHAEQLRVQVADLEQRTDAAVEEYDGAQEALATAVTARFRADAALEQARGAAAVSAGVRTARVRRLYELGGPPALYGGLLRAGSPTEALHGVEMAQRLLGTDARLAAGEEQAGQVLAAAAAVAEQAAGGQVRETRRVDALVAQVQGLLAQQQQVLATADADVVRLAQEQQAEQQRRQQAAFAAQLAAARSAAGPELAPAGSSQPASARAEVVLAAARAQVGKPYVWGSTGPGSFDCSGLTRWAYAAAGIGLPRTSRQQWGVGPHPSLAELQPGDLLFWSSSPTDPSTIHHVAMYAGDGLMVAAPHTGALVQVQRVYAGGYLGATRVL